MASNVNYKFVAILSGALLLLFAGVAAVAAVVLTKSGEDYMLEGREFEAAGDMENAAKMYERAVGHPEGRTNPEWLRAWQNAITKTTPPSRVEYLSAYREKYRGILKQLATVERTNIETQKAHLENIAREVILAPFNRDNYEFLIAETNEVLRVFEREDPGPWETLRRYRGASTAAIMAQGISVDREDVDLAKEDLEAALRADPSDAEALLGLTQWYGARTQRLRNIDADQATEVFAEGVDRIAEFMDANPNHALGSLIQLRMELTRRLTGLDLEFPFTTDRTELEFRFSTLAEDVDAVFENYRAEGLENLDILDMGRLEAIELQVDPPARFRRALALADDILEARPNDTDVMFLRAAIADRRGDLDDAEQLFEQIIATPIRPLSPEGVRQFGYRVQAIAKLAEVSVRQWAAADEADKPAVLEKAKQRRAALAGEVPEGSELLVLADARIALAEGETRESERLLARYNDLTSGNDPTALLLAARIAMAERSMGRARTLLERIIELQPSNLEALLDLANVQRSLLDYEAARETLAEVERLSPGNERLVAIRQQLDQLTGEARPDDPVQAALLEANRTLLGSATEAGNVESAIARLETAMDDLNAPAPIAIGLARLYSQTDRTDRALATLDRGLAQTPDSETMLALQRALSSDDYVGELVEMTMESDQPEIEKLIGVWRLYSSNGMRDEASQTLDRLAELSPSDPRVVGLTFDRALIAEDYDEARRIADIARENDADGLGGRLFAGRLAAAQGDRADAIEIFQEAIDFDPTNVAAQQLKARMLIAEGNTADGVPAYAEAVAMQPNDIGLIIEYIDALRVANRPDEALDVARESQRFGRGNVDFRERWLRLEASVGDKEFARQRRESIAQAEPDNRVNRVALAGVLLDLGRREDAKAMIDQLRAEQDTLPLAQLAARWHADARDIQSARNTFVEYIVSQDREELTSAPYIAMGRFLVARGEQSSGIAALEQAREFQNPETLEADKTLGDTLMGLGRYADAIGSYQTVIETGADTEDGLYRQRMVECLIRTGEYEQAAAALALLPAERREQLTVVLLEADLRRAQGDIDTAVEVLNAAAADYPNEPLVYMKRAQVLGVEEATRTDAMNDLNEALRVDPRNWQAMRLRAALHAEMGDSDAAIEDLKAAVQVNPTLDELRFGLMTELINRGRASEAEQIAEATIDVRPSDLDLIVTSGDLFGRGDDWTRASRMYERAWRQAKIQPIGRRYIESLLQQTPPNPRVAQEVIAEMGDAVQTQPTIRMARAIALKLQRRDDLARRDADATFDLVVTTPAAFTFWLESLERMYGSTEAVADYLDDFERRAADVPNTAQWLQVLRGRVLVEDDATRSEGERLLTNAIENLDASPQQNAALKTLGGSYYATERYDQAVAAWQRGLDRYPNDPEFANNVAFTLTKHLDRAAEALPLAEQAAELAPDRANVLDTLGITLLKVGQPGRADEVLNRALPLAREASTRAEVLLHLAQAKLAQDNVEAAQNFATRATEVSNGLSELPSGYADELAALKQEIDSRG